MTENAKTQVPQTEWAEQWSILDGDVDQPPELFLEWIAPNTMELFKGARVLDAGCGGGHHSSFVAGFAKEVVSLDLNTPDVCRKRLERHKNVKIHHGDLTTIGPEELGGPFDVVYSIGVLQHTADPDKGFANLVRHVRPGGRIIAWVYSVEGNWVARFLVEPVRKVFLRFLPRKLLWFFSWVITLQALVFMHTLYRLPLRFLPMYEYLARSRTLTVRKVAGNVFDKLNAPHTDFVSRERIEGWLRRDDLTQVQLSPHLGVSWCASATKI
jgi:2-polyprenyl-3-methyl-5-hydroxy-6-metoxy-1,4-benzoquinol methylase